MVKHMTLLPPLFVARDPKILRWMHWAYLLGSQSFFIEAAEQFCWHATVIEDGPNRSLTIGGETLDTYFEGTPEDHPVNAERLSSRSSYF